MTATPRIAVGSLCRARAAPVEPSVWEDPPAVLLELPRAEPAFEHGAIAEGLADRPAVAARPQTFQHLFVLRIGGKIFQLIRIGFEVMEEQAIPATLRLPRMMRFSVAKTLFL